MDTYRAAIPCERVGSPTRNLFTPGDRPHQPPVWPAFSGHRRLFGRRSVWIGDVLNLPKSTRNVEEPHCHPLSRTRHSLSHPPLSPDQKGVGRKRMPPPSGEIAPCHPLKTRKHPARAFTTRRTSTAWCQTAPHQVNAINFGCTHLVAAGRLRDHQPQFLSWANHYWRSPQNIQKR